MGHSRPVTGLIYPFLPSQNNEFLVLFVDRFIELKSEVSSLYLQFCCSFLNSDKPSINKIIAFCGIKQDDEEEEYDDDNDSINNNSVPVAPLLILIWIVILIHML